MMDAKPHIKSFVSNIIDKNYVLASADLSTVVETKIKQKIANCYVRACRRSFISDLVIFCNINTTISRYTLSILT